MSDHKTVSFDIPFAEQLRWCTLAGRENDARMTEIAQFAQRHHDLILENAKEMQGFYAGLATRQVLFVRAATVAWTRFMQGDPKWQEPYIPPSKEG
jgi:peroxiredoxin